MGGAYLENIPEKAQQAKRIWRPTFFPIHWKNHI
jgi:hypothetical protein